MNVGPILNTTFPPVPVLVLTPVPPLATGNAVELYDKVMFPEEVTAEPAVRKGAADVSIPTLVTAELHTATVPALVKTFPAVPMVLNPVPPLAMGRGIDKLRLLPMIDPPASILLTDKTPSFESCISPEVPDPKVKPLVA